MTKRPTKEPSADTSSTLPTCFIAMPMSTPKVEAERSFADQEHFAEVIHGIMIPAVKAAGFEPISPETQDNSIITATIIKNLHECDMVLGDITARNPNVFFELGIRACFNKPFCLVCDDAEGKFPFDISAHNICKYNGALLPRSVTASIDAIAAHLKASKGKTSNDLWHHFGIKLSGDTPETTEPQQAIIAMLGELQRSVKNLQRTDEPTVGRQRDLHTEAEPSPARVRPRASMYDLRDVERQQRLLLAEELLVRARDRGLSIVENNRLTIDVSRLSTRLLASFTAMLPGRTVSTPDRHQLVCTMSPQDLPDAVAALFHLPPRWRQSAMMNGIELFEPLDRALLDDAAFS